MNERANYIPEGFHTVTPYLVGSGTARLMEFLKRAFGAEETFRMARPDGTIGHASMRIGDAMVEMADAMAGRKAMPSAMHVYVPNADEVYRRAVEAGATSLYEPKDMPYGDHEGGVRDPAGNDWYIATHKRSGHFVPEGFRSVTPGVSVVGADRLLEFLEKGLAASLRGKHLAANGTVDYAAVRIGDAVIEVSEAHGEWGPRTATLHVYVPDADAVYAQALVAGAASLQEMKDQSYGERNGGFADAWGNHWYVATYRETLSTAELERRAAG
jgi:uncharacterized glyoxalase superfamily protein PhnB